RLNALVLLSGQANARTRCCQQKQTVFHTMRNSRSEQDCQGKQRASAVSTSAVDECASLLQTPNGDAQCLRRRCCIVEDGERTIRRKVPNGRRLGDLGGKVYIIVELPIKLWRQQAPTDEQLPGDYAACWLSAQAASQMPDEQDVAEHRKKDKPSPEGQRAVGPLAEYSMYSFSMSESKRHKVTAWPNSEPCPAALD